MSRVGRKVIVVPAGVKVSVSETALEVQGPKGKLTTPVPPGIKFAPRGPGAVLPARERRAPAARLPRPGAGAGPERGQGRDRGVQPRTSTSWAWATAPRSRATRSSSPSATRTRSSTRSPRGSRSRSRSRRGSRCRASTGRRWARWRPRSASLRQARSLQAEGDPLRRRGAEEEGGQGRSDRREVTEERERRGAKGPRERPPKREMSTKTKQDIRQRLHDRIRKKIRGTPERPRLAVFRSQGHIYAQVIDDDAGRTLCAASSLDKDLRGRSRSAGATWRRRRSVGTLIAEPRQGEGDRRRRVRPRRLPVPRPHQGPGRRRPRGRAEVLAVRREPIE